jgi:hypothetical protein
MRGGARRRASAGVCACTLGCSGSRLVQPDRAVRGGPRRRRRGHRRRPHRVRFPNRDHFAAYNGTAPIEVSSGGRKVCRLSQRGNRGLNHAIQMVAVTQIRYQHTKGRACYDKKLAEDKTPKEALRCLKRQISDAIFACLQADARRAAAKSPGGQPGNHSASRAAGSHPERRLFGQATPGPATQPLRPPLLPFPRRCQLMRAGGRVKDRAQPGRTAAPARRPPRGPPASR